MSDCALSGRCHGCGGCDLADPYSATAGPARARLRPVIFPREEAKTSRRDIEPRPHVEQPSRVRSRLRFRFAKMGRAVHLSHLDTMAHVLRAVRLAGLPVIYSQGYTPRPRIGFSPACPTGVQSHAEYFEASCNGYPDPDKYAGRLRGLLPVGLSVLEAEEVRADGDPVSEQIRASTYRVAVTSTLNEEATLDRIARFVLRDRCVATMTRKGKVRAVDARALVRRVCYEDGAMVLSLLHQRTATLKIREAVAVVLGPEVLGDISITKLAVDLGRRGPDSVDSNPVDLQETAFDLTSLGMQESAPSSTRREAVGAVIPNAT